MPLNLIHGPPNSGRAGLVLRRFAATLDRDPILVVPNHRRRLRLRARALRGRRNPGRLGDDLRRVVPHVATAGGAPPGAELTPAQRLRAVAVAIDAAPARLGPLRRSAARPGFAAAFERLLDELQAAGVEPGAVEASAATLEGSAYLGDIATLFAGYAEARERSGRVDAHGIAREAIALLRRDGAFWGERPVFLYGLDDLTPQPVRAGRGAGGDRPR